jgi:putative acetyltransferase
MPNMPFTLRGATASDADAIAAVYCASFRLLTFLPMLHTEVEYRSFIANVIFRDCEVAVAEDNSGIVSFLARHGEEVRLLHTPDRIGLGAGTQLIEAAKKQGRCARTVVLSSQRSRRRHYEARGFRPIRFTDGADNEEKTPDVRYRWERAADG